MGIAGTKSTSGGLVDINTEAEYDEETTVKKQLHEKPEKKDVVADINCEGKYDDNNLVEDDRELSSRGTGSRKLRG